MTIRLKGYIANVTLVMPMLFMLAGCFPWPSGQEADPVNSDTIPNADVTVGLSGKFQEGDNSVLLLNVRLSADNNVPIKIADGEYLEIQTLMPGGDYEKGGNAVISNSVSIELTGFNAPSSYKIRFHRASGEVDELLRFTVNVKLQSSLSTSVATYGIGDSVDVVLNWVAEGMKSDIVNPEMYLKNALNCADDNYFNATTVPVGSATESMPFGILVDDVVETNPTAVLPCMSNIVISYFPMNGEIAIINGDVGPTFKNPGQISGGIYIEAHSKTHTVSIE